MAPGTQTPVWTPKFPVHMAQACLFSEGQITGPSQREGGLGANGQSLHIQVRVSSGSLWCRTEPGVRRRGGEQALSMLPLSGTKLQGVLDFSIPV